MRKCIYLVLTIIVCSTWAAGTMRLSGKVHSFTPEYVELNDGREIFRIRRDKLSGHDEKKLAKMKVGTKVELTVSFEAVESTKSAKK